MLTPELVEHLKSSREVLVKSAGETVVREVETAKKEATKQTIEGGVRDHLRGFSRTIPSFLMAYGDAGTTLEKLDEVTSRTYSSRSRASRQTSSASCAMEATSRTGRPARSSTSMEVCSTP